VVHNQARSIGREVDVKFEEQTADGAGDSLFGGESKEDVGAGVDEIDEEFRGQGWTQSLGLDGEKNEVGVSGCSMLEEAEARIFRRPICDLKATIYKMKTCVSVEGAVEGG
jgi:hypothetical protein